MYSAELLALGAEAWGRDGSKRAGNNFLFFNKCFTDWVAIGMAEHKGKGTGIKTGKNVEFVSTITRVICVL